MLNLIGDSLATPLFNHYCQNEINNVNSEISMRISYNIEVFYYKLLSQLVEFDGGMFKDGLKHFDSETSFY